MRSHAARDTRILLFGYRAEVLFDKRPDRYATSRLIDFFIFVFF